MLPMTEILNQSNLSQKSGTISSEMQKISAGAVFVERSIFSWGRVPKIFLSIWIFRMGKRSLGFIESKK